MSDLIEGEDFYYNNDGNIVLTSLYHIKRKECCGNGCLHCPYEYKNVALEKRKLLLERHLPIIKFNIE
ncbi:MAG: DUF5522 domain-containing protein [Ferruginibacter sp.]|nr:hypothetical protein [Ferruginibacter sp.]